MPGSSSRSSRGSFSSPGANGAGKTNLLESLHVGTQGFSPRTRSDMQLIRQGATAGRVELTGRRGTVPVSVSVALSATEPKRARLDGAVLRSAEQLRERARHARLHPRPPRRRQGRAGRPARLHRPLARAGSTRPARTSRSTTPPRSASATPPCGASPMGLSGRDVLAPWTAQVADLGAMLTAARRDVIELLQPGFAERAGELGLADASLGYDAEPPTISLARGAARTRPRAGHDRRRPAPRRDRDQRAATATSARSARRASSGSPSSRCSSPRRS